MEFHFADGITGVIQVLVIVLVVAYLIIVIKASMGGNPGDR